MSDARPATQPDPQSFVPGSSVLVEKILEHQFLADLLRELWGRGERGVEVLRAEVDAAGYDIVVGVGDTLRHIQLKSSHLTAKKPSVGVNVALQNKSGGCIVWLVYDASTLKTEGYLWLGASLDGVPLGLGERRGKHAKANSLGVKNVRESIRVVSKGQFERLPTIGEIADRLFGPREA